MGTVVRPAAAQKKFSEELENKKIQDIFQDNLQLYFLVSITKKILHRKRGQLHGISYLVGALGQRGLNPSKLVYDPNQSMKSDDMKQ